MTEQRPKRPKRHRVAALIFLLLAVLALARLGVALFGPEPPHVRAEQAFRQALETGTTAPLHVAAQAWKDSLAWSPADPYAWTGLAWAETLRGAPPAYGARLMERSAMLSPHIPALTQTRARWHALWTPPPAAPPR